MLMITSSSPAPDSESSVTARQAPSPLRSFARWPPRLAWRERRVDSKLQLRAGPFNSEHTPSAATQPRAATSRYNGARHGLGVAADEIATWHRSLAGVRRGWAGNQRSRL